MYIVGIVQSKPNSNSRRSFRVTTVKINEGVDGFLYLPPIHKGLTSNFKAGATYYLLDRFSNAFIDFDGELSDAQTPVGISVHVIVQSWVSWQ